jgi:flagellar biosynthetic protein FliR
MESLGGHFLQNILQPFTLVVCRLTPLFAAVGMTPFGRFPFMVRLICLLVISITMIITNIDSWSLLSNANWIIGLAFELMLGILILVGFQLTLSSIQIFGRVVDMQIGFAAAGVIDPVSHNNDPLIGHIFTLFFILAFFLTDTHHLLLLSLNELVSLIPLGSWQGSFNFSSLMAFFTSQLSFAMLFFAPVLMGLWLLDLFNGLISKTMPQMNVYFVMLPLKIGVGLFILSISSQYFKPLIKNIFTSLLNWFSGGWM